MKKLRSSAAITVILGALSLLAIIMLYLALSDIAGQSENLTLEWYVAGICIIIISAFTISTFVTLGLLLKSEWLWLNFNRENPVTAK